MMKDEKVRQGQVLTIMTTLSRAGFPALRPGIYARRGGTVTFRNLIYRARTSGKTPYDATAPQQ